jgi:hypothetical protein
MSLARRWQRKFEKRWQKSKKSGGEEDIKLFLGPFSHEGGK